MTRCWTIASLFDLHADIPTRILKTEKSAVSFSPLFFRQIQTAAFFIPLNTRSEYAYYKNMYSAFNEKNSIPVNDLSSRRTVLFSLENGGELLSDAERILEFKNDGVTSVSLTWNSDNSLAGGAFGSGGLTDKGSGVIEILNRFGMALDISHLNHKSAVTAALSADFVLASHSNSYSVFPHPRNLSDSVLKIIRDKKGLVGINFYPEFLGRGPVFESIRRHIEYMLSQGLADNIAVGSDLDGAEMDSSLSKTEDVFALYSYISDCFRDKRLVDKIFFENAYVFYQKLFDKRT